MSEATFTCPRCGNEHREGEKKEVFVNEGGTETKKTVCPKCLDEILSEAGRAVGVEGDEKKAAVAVGDAAGSTDRETYGEQGEDTTGEGPRS
jgi:ribosomal protein S27AE